MSRPFARRFRLLYLSLATVAILALGVTVKIAGEPRQKPLHGPSEGHTVPEKDWGHVRAYDGLLQFFLGPASDQRRKYELGFGRVMFTSAGIGVSNDGGKTFYPLQGEPMGECGYHWQGQGVNVIVAIAKCVPGWATVTGDPEGGHAAEWIRVENLSPKARVVILKYDPLP